LLRQLGVLKYRGRGSSGESGASANSRALPHYPVPPAAADTIVGQDSARV
jgi:hypothetical protein